MLKEFLEKMAEGNNLSFDESEKIMDIIMKGNISDIGIASLITALKVKGESPTEIAGFASSMRKHCKKVDIGDHAAIDVCGTGGDKSGTFNISTAASFVVAGAGIKVAKHGNRSISSSSGSADVLTELGVDINPGPEKIISALKKANLAFFFAPAFHPSMKYAAPVRKELKVKTIFNILGPLCNPASVKRQMIGTYSRDAAKKMIGALEYLDMEKVCFINTRDLFDEIVLNGETSVFEYTKLNPLREYKITAQDFGVKEIDISALRGGTPAENAKIIENILLAEESAGKTDVICANAAMGLYVAGYSDSLSDCFKKAKESINDGSALKVLNELRDI